MALYNAVAAPVDGTPFFGSWPELETPIQQSHHLSLLFDIDCVANHHEGSLFPLATLRPVHPGDAGAVPPIPAETDVAVAFENLQAASAFFQMCPGNTSSPIIQFICVGDRYNNGDYPVAHPNGPVPPRLFLLRTSPLRLLALSPEGVRQARNLTGANSLATVFTRITNNGIPIYTKPSANAVPVPGVSPPPIAISYEGKVTPGTANALFPVDSNAPSTSGEKTHSFMSRIVAMFAFNNCDMTIARQLIGNNLDAFSLPARNAFRNRIPEELSAQNFPALHIDNYEVLMMHSASKIFTVASNNKISGLHLLAFMPEGHVFTSTSEIMTSFTNWISIVIALFTRNMPADQIYYNNMIAPLHAIVNSTAMDSLSTVHINAQVMIMNDFFVKFCTLFINPSYHTAGTPSAALLALLPQSARECFDISPASMSTLTAMYKRNQEKIRHQYPNNSLMKPSDFIPFGAPGSTVTKVSSSPPSSPPVSKTTKRKASQLAAATKKATLSNTAANATTAPATNTRNFATKTVGFAPATISKPPTYSTYCINDFAGKTIPPMPVRSGGYACNPKPGKPACTRIHYNLVPGQRLPKGIADDLIGGLTFFSDTNFCTNFRQLVNGMV